MKRIILLAAAGLLLAAWPVGAEVISRIAAIVNDEIITTGQLDQELDKRLAGEKEQQTLSDEMRQNLRRELLSELIEETLVDQRAKKLGIQISEAEVDQAIEDVQRQNGINRDQLAEALAAQGLTYAEYRKQLSRQLLNFRLIGREIRSELEVTNQELRNYFQEHIDEYREAPFVRLSRISFPLSAQAGAAQLATLRSMSREAQQRLRQGQPFAEVLAAYSEGKGAEGGAMGTFRTGELTEPFAGAVSGLAAGEVSEVVETPQGFHVLYMEEKNPGRVPGFEEVRDRLSTLVLERKRQEALENWAENLKKEAHIEIKL